jgi:hypothetical protein
MPAPADWPAEPSLDRRRPPPPNCEIQVTTARQFAGLRVYFIRGATGILRNCTVTGTFPHPNLSDRVNRNIVQSEIEGGVYLHDLPHASTLEVETQNRSYTIVHFGKGEALISGHPEFCPRPVRVKIEGSNWGGSMLKPSFVGRGMHLEFRHPDYERPIITSRIVEIRQLPAA